MITATYTLFAPAGHEEEILETLRIFKGPTEAQRECLACAISQDADDPGVITYLEEWQTAKALEDHIRSDHYRELLFIIEMSARAPEIRFRAATETKGIEFIEALEEAAERDSLLDQRIKNAAMEKRENKINDAIAMILAKFPPTAK